MYKTWCPLWSDITKSSIWDQSKEVRILWITMLAMKDSDGIVDAATTALATYSRLTLEETERALEVLSSPDPHTRTQDEEGRRIKRVEGGWVVINHLKYRNLIKEGYASYMNAQRQKRYRERHGQSDTGNAAKPLPDCTSHEVQRKAKAASE